MVQLNLLPDIKVEYIKSRSQRRFVMLLSTLVISVSLGAVLLLALIVYGYQNTRLSSLEKSINEDASKLAATPGLNEILTVQNQLGALDTLHAEKPAVTRLPQYLSQIIISEAVLDSITMDLATNTITISGTTDSLQDVNKLVDTLKFAEISRGEEGETDRSRAFSSVVLTGFDRIPNNSTYTITMLYDPVIFQSSEKNISLVVPDTVSTRSTTEQPRVLFDAPVESTEATR
jgi:hypothetical protein